MASALNNGSPRKLPSGSQVHWQDDVKECNAVELRGRKELPEPYEAAESESKVKKTK